MVWIKRYHNDVRDYLIKTHEIEIPDTRIDATPPVYDPHAQYEIVLCQEQNEETGETTYFYLEESKNNVVSPRFRNRQQAEYWFANNQRFD